MKQAIHRPTLCSDLEKFSCFPCVGSLARPRLPEVFTYILQGKMLLREESGLWSDRRGKNISRLLDSFGMSTGKAPGQRVIYL